MMSYSCTLATMLREFPVFFFFLNIFSPTKNEKVYVKVRLLSDKFGNQNFSETKLDDFYH